MLRKDPHFKQVLWVVSYLWTTFWKLLQKQILQPCFVKETFSGSKHRVNYKCARSIQQIFPSVFSNVPFNKPSLLQIALLVCCLQNTTCVVPPQHIWRRWFTKSKMHIVLSHLPTPSIKSFIFRVQVNLTSSSLSWMCSPSSNFHRTYRLVYVASATLCWLIPLIYHI